MDYFLDIVIMAGIYSILVLSANLTVGMANLFTLCQAAFYGIGAYMGAFFLLHFNLPFTLVALAVMLVAGAASLLLSFASNRLKGDFFMLATLGFQALFSAILFNWDSVTGGDKGIKGIPSIRLAGVLPLEEDWAFFVFLLLIVIMTALLFFFMLRSPFGRALRSIRTDELATEALGRNTFALKAWAFFLSAAFAGLAGLLYASFAHGIHPKQFSLDCSILILTALFVGGAGDHVRGPVIGAVAIAILQEVFEFFDLPAKLDSGNLNQILYGLTLIALMFRRPLGAVSQKSSK